MIIQGYATDIRIDGKPIGTVTSFTPAPVPCKDCGAPVYPHRMNGGSVAYWYLGPAAWYMCAECTRKQEDS